MNNQNQQQQVQVNPMVKKTITAINALDSLRAFYTDSLNESLQQNVNDAQLLKQMGESLKNTAAANATLKSELSDANEFRDNVLSELKSGLKLLAHNPAGGVQFLDDLLKGYVDDYGPVD